MAVGPPNSMWGKGLFWAGAWFKGMVWGLAVGALWFWLIALDKGCDGEQAFCKGEAKACLVAFEATSMVF